MVLSLQWSCGAVNVNGMPRKHVVNFYFNLWLDFVRELLMNFLTCGHVFWVMFKSRGEREESELRDWGERNGGEKNWAERGTELRRSFGQNIFFRLEGECRVEWLRNYRSHKILREQCTECRGKEEKRRCRREQKEQAGFSLPWDRTGPMVEGKAGLVLLKEKKQSFFSYKHGFNSFHIKKVEVFSFCM